MKSEEEIKKRILSAQQGKSRGKKSNSDIAYISNLRVEKALKWVLED